MGGAQMRGCNILKIPECVNVITPVIFIFKIRGTYSILPKPTQFQSKTPKNPGIQPKHTVNKSRINFDCHVMKSAHFA